MLAFLGKPGKRGWTGIGLITLGIALILSYGRWANEYAHKDNTGPFFAYVQNIVTMLLALIGLVAGIVGFLQLRGIKKTRDAELTILILNRYIEDPKLFKIRGFINTHMAQLNQTLASFEKEGFCNHYILQEKVSLLSRRAITYGDLLHFVMCMNHSSMLMIRLPFSYDLRQDFRPYIKRHWELLQPLINYERERRGGDAKEWYAKHFEDLYKQIICRPSVKPRTRKT